MYYVYAHINPVNLKPFYIGKGKDNRFISTEGRNSFWKNTVNKYGFSAVILADGLTDLQSLEIEKQYIEKFGLRKDGGTLVNLTYGGRGGKTIGDHNRESVIEKCRLSKLGDKNPNYGKPSTFLGKSHTPEAKAKLSLHRKGKKLSPEHKEKVLKGLEKAKAVNAAKAMQVECLITGRVWGNRQKCIQDIGISLASFKQWIYKNRPVKGYFLQYKRK